MHRTCTNTLVSFEFPAPFSVQPIPLIVSHGSTLQYHSPASDSFASEIVMVHSRLFSPHWLYHIFANLHQGSAESTENSHLGLIWRGTWYNVLFLVLRLFMHSKAVWVYSFEIALGAVEHCPAMRTDIVLLKSCSCQKLCSTSVTSKYSRGSTLHLEPHCWQCGGLL